MSLVILPKTTLVWKIEILRMGSLDLPPDHNLIKHATPQSCDRRAEFASIDIDRVVIEEVPHLVIHCKFLFRGWLFVVLETIKPQAKNDHEVQATQWMFHTPVCSTCSAHPFDTLQRNNLNTLKAFLNDLDHFLRSLDFVSRCCHGRRNFVRVMISESFLNGLEINFEACSGISVHGHGVEYEWMPLVWRTELYNDRLGLAQLEGFLPRFQGQAELVLRDDVLESFKASFMIPHFEKESVDHDSGCKSTVSARLALEETIVRFSDSDDGRGRETIAPRLLVNDLQVPQRFRGWER